MSRVLNLLLLFFSFSSFSFQHSNMKQCLLCSKNILAVSLLKLSKNTEAAHRHTWLALTIAFQVTETQPKRPFLGTRMGSSRLSLSEEKLVMQHQHLMRSKHAPPAPAVVCTAELSFTCRSRKGECDPNHMIHPPLLCSKIC